MNLRGRRARQSPHREFGLYIVQNISDNVAPTTTCHGRSESLRSAGARASERSAIRNPPPTAGHGYRFRWPRLRCNSRASNGRGQCTLSHAARQCSDSLKTSTLARDWLETGSSKPDKPRGFSFWAQLGRGVIQTQDIIVCRRCIMLLGSSPPSSTDLRLSG